MLGLKGPVPTVTLTRARYDEIMEVHRAAEDLSALLVDFAGSRLPADQHLLEIKAIPGLPRAIFSQAVTELREAIAISTSNTA